MPRTEARFDGDPASVQAARRFVGHALRTFGFPDAERRVELLTSEVVTNAVRHAGTPYGVAVDCQGSGVVVRVEDASPTFPAPGVASPDAEGGRGLMIVGALSDAWGIEAEGARKAVWFRVDRSPTPPAAGVPGGP